jgi:hypothetical protein
MPRSVEEATGELRIPDPKAGVVVDRQDPLSLHRVRVRIPGIIEPASAWASPLTMGGGGPGRGGHVVPELGADVLVFFVGGDPERPMYAAAGWGLPKTGSEMPVDARDAEQAELVQTMQLGSLVITVDERERDEEAGTGQLFKIEDQVSGDVLLYDVKFQGWRLKGSYSLELQAEGAIRLTATQIWLNERLVANVGGPI